MSCLFIQFLFRLQNSYLLFRGCNINILLFDYRGYGRSTGKPSESGFYTDARAVYNYVRSRTDLNQEKIFLFGRSLGGAVAISLGKNNNVLIKPICKILISSCTSC